MKGQGHGLGFDSAPRSIIISVITEKKSGFSHLTSIPETGLGWKRTGFMTLTMSQVPIVF
jgi:hypothetical protein